jgi:hypothetical protein
MRTAKKVRWDPIIARLANYNVKQGVYEEPRNDVEPSRVKANWVAAVEKRRSDEDFEAFLHGLFDKNGPVVKYQNPDAWRYPTKKNADAQT